MVVRIRLARFGKRNAPFYNIVVAQARTARNSKPMEVLGTYDPIPKEPAPGSPLDARKHKDIRLDTARAKYWIGVGAQPSDTAWRVLAMAGILQPKWNVQQKSHLRAQEEEASIKAEEKASPAGPRIIQPGGSRGKKSAEATM